MFPLDAPSLVTTTLRRTGRDALGDERLSPAIDVLCADLDVTSHLHLSGRREARRLLLQLLENRGRPTTPDPSPQRDIDQPVDRAEPSNHQPGGPVILVAALPTTPVARIEEHLGRRPCELATWASTPTGRAGGFATSDAMHPLAIDLHSPYFECAWHVPTYAEWFSEQDLAPSLRALADDLGTTTTPVVVRSLAFGLNAVSSLPVGFELTRVAPFTTDVDAFVGAVVAYRRRFSHRVDASAVERYWRWRLDAWSSPTADS